MQKIGHIPDFTEDTPVGGEVEEVSVASTESPAQAVEEKETPTEPPAEEQPSDSQEPTDDTGALSELKGQLKKEIKGLAIDRKKLILELDDLREQRRQTREAELKKVQQEVDELQDLNQDDIKIVERILQAKGYVSRNQLDQMLFEARKQDEISKFLLEYPEYGEKNDADRRKFEALLEEVKLYREPGDPKTYGTILRRAHKNLSSTQGSGERDIAVKQKRAEIAGMGSSGAQRSSSVKSFDQKTRERLLAGGWSEEDISNMEKRNS